MYISYWLKLQPDLLQKMTDPALGGQTWRSVFAWKTGDAGDYRVILYWEVRADNEANGGLPFEMFWKVDNCSIAVPVGEWFKFEIFWHRSSGSDGRVWVAVNGNIVAAHFGPNIGVNNSPINRIMMPLYTEHPVPWYQWVDDLQIWGGFPTAAPGGPLV
jgi:hypothetical protein